MKNVNYLSVYQEKYKNLPNIIFWSSLIFWGLVAIAAGIIALSATDEGFFGVVFLGSGVAVGFAWLSRFLTAILISQKVIVADTLLSMANNAPAPIVEDELPDL
ncbi:MAG: hypothetical protein E7534_02805 [Ruminococcaceae bacterium]|nr:hypothetical protein [Oscillospiraceae bacterium]